MSLIQFVCLTPTCTHSCVAYADDKPRCNGCNKTMTSVARLTKANAELREALKFYSQPTHWRVDGGFVPASPDNEYRPDCGYTARNALANSSEGE